MNEEELQEAPVEEYTDPRTGETSATKPTRESSEPVEQQPTEPVEVDESFNQKFLGTLDNIVDPFGKLPEDKRRIVSQSVAAPIMALPDFGMDVVGMIPGGNKLDDAYDNATRFDNNLIQGARGALSVIIPSAFGVGAVSAATKASKLTGLTRGLTAVGGTALLDAGIIGLSDQGEEENMSRTLADSFPGFFGPRGKMPIPEKWKTQPGMTPEQRKWVNMYENGAFSIVGDVIGYSILAGKGAMQWFRPLDKASAAFKESQIWTNADKATVKAISNLDESINDNTVVIARLDDELQRNPDPELLNQRNKIAESVEISKVKKDEITQQYRDTGQSEVTENGLESFVERNQTSRDIQTQEIAQRKLTADIDGTGGFDPDITPNLSNPAATARQSIPPGNVAQNMLDTTAIKNGDAIGDPTPLITDPMINKGFRAYGDSRNQVKAFAEIAKEAGKWEGFVKDFRYSVDDMSEAAFKIYGDILTAGSVDDVRSLFISNRDIKNLEIAGEVVQKTYVNTAQQTGIGFALRDLVDTYLGRPVNEMSARVMDTLGKEITTASEAVNQLGPEVVNTNRAMDLILDKMEFLMEEYGTAKYVAGWQLRNQRWWQKLIPGQGEEITAKIADEFTNASKLAQKKAKAYRSMLDELKDKNPELLRAFTDAYAFSKGDIDTIAKLNKWAEQQVSLGSLLVSPNPKELTLLAQGFKAVRLNNVLSGISVLRAGLGNGAELIRMPLTAMIHAGGRSLFHGDWTPIKRAAYLYGAISETNARALGDAWEMMKKVNHDEKFLLKAARSDYVVQESQKWGALTDQASVWKKEGNVGKSMLFGLADTFHKLGKHRALRAPTTGMTGVDAYTNTMMATYLSRARAYEEVFDKAGWNMDALKAAEKKHYLNMFDKSGLPKDDTLKAFSGEIALNLDHPMAEAVTQATTAVPALHGMFMFPKTSINWMNKHSSYIPFNRLPFLKNKYSKILTAGSNRTKIRAALAEHGIDLDTDKHAMNSYRFLKEEYEARLEFSGLLTGSLLGYALAGNIRGGGHHNNAKRRANRDDFNYREKTIKLGDKWVSFKGIAGLDPILTLLGDIGFYHNDLSQPMLEDYGRKIQWILSANFFNESHLAGLEPLVGLTQGDGGAAIKRHIAGEARTMIPISGLLGVATNLIDDTFKDVHDDFWGYIKNRLPGLKNTLPTHIDITNGKPLSLASDNPWIRSMNSVSPINMYDDTTPWGKKLMRLGYTFKDQFKKDSSGNDYSKQEIEQVKQLVGKQQIWKELEKVVNSKDFDEAMSEIQQMIRSGQSWQEVEVSTKGMNIFTKLNAITNRAKQKAEREMRKTNPALKERARDQRKIDSKVKQMNIKEATQLATESDKKFKRVKGILEFANPQ